MDELIKTSQRHSLRLQSPNESIPEERSSIVTESSSGSGKKTRPRRTSISSTQIANISYHGINIYSAAAQGNLPIVVLLWGMASVRHINLVVPDDEGSNPMHYAAMADTAEVLIFLNQQTKGFFPSSDIRLVDMRNSNGEIPLIKAASCGKIATVKYLLDEGSNPFLRDNNGRTIFIASIRNNHFWCLIFLYKTLCLRYDEKRTEELLFTCDNDGHSPIDWAADIGCINIIEYLIRLGMSPYRMNNLHRGPLYWAAISHQVSTVRYLLKLGCDPHQKDIHGKSPYDIAIQRGFPDLISAMHQKPFCHPNKSLALIIPESNTTYNNSQRYGISNRFTREDSSNTVTSALHSEDESNSGSFSGSITELDLDVDSGKLQISPFADPSISKVNIDSSENTTTASSPSTSNKLSHITQAIVGPKNQLTVASGVIAVAAATVIGGGSGTSNNSSSSNSNYLSPTRIKSLSSESHRSSLEPKFGLEMSYVSSIDGKSITPIRTTLQSSSLPSIYSTKESGSIESLPSFQSMSTKDDNTTLSVSPSPSTSTSTSANLHLASIPNLYTVYKSRKYSYALTRLYQTRLNYSMAHGFKIMILWSMTIIIPYWAFIILIGCLIPLYRYLNRKAQSYQNSTGVHSEGLYSEQMICKPLPLWHRFVTAREKLIGVYIGCYSAYGLYLALALCIGLRKNTPDDDTIYRHVYSVTNNDYIQIGGIGAYHQHKSVYMTAVALYLLGGVCWFLLVWVLDPGMVTDRDTNFDEIMDQSYLAQGPPPQQFYCKTTLVKKPLRAKYCRHSGYVIARMDHYCMWLNMSIGEGNHRIFMLFLYSHVIFGIIMIFLIARALHQGVDTEDVCSVAEAIASSEYFYAVMLFLLTIVTVCSLGMLMFEQTINIFNNITTNERIHQPRYPWIYDDQGHLRNQFDRGYLSNFLEFWKLSFRSVDYYNVFQTSSSNSNMNMNSQSMNMNMNSSDKNITSMSNSQRNNQTFSRNHSNQNDTNTLKGDNNNSRNEDTNNNSISSSSNLFHVSLKGTGNEHVKCPLTDNSRLSSRNNVLASKNNTFTISTDDIVSEKHLVSCSSTNITSMDNKVNTQMIDSMPPDRSSNGKFESPSMNVGNNISTTTTMTTATATVATVTVAITSLRRGDINNFMTI